MKNYDLFSGRTKVGSAKMVEERKDQPHQTMWKVEHPTGKFTFYGTYHQLHQQLKCMIEDLCMIGRE